MKYRVSACLLALLLASLGSPIAASAATPDVQSLKEAQLRPGALPAWETEAERASRTPRNPRHYGGTSLPEPPAAGYRVPAEFEKVAAFVVSQGDWWPEEEPMLIAMIQQGTAAEGAGAIVLTRDDVSSYESLLKGKGLDMTRVHVVAPPEGLDAKWARDFGAISILQQGAAGHLALGDLHYYNKRPHDDAFVAFLSQQTGLTRYGLEGADHVPADDAMLFMEGGNFQTDGKGTCILSDDIDDDNAKAGNTQADTTAEVEQILGQYLGCKKIIWLTPPPNTGTGHVDMYTKLLTPTDILVIDPPGTSNQDKGADTVIEQNVEILKASTNLDGNPFVIHRVTIPTINTLWTYRTYTNSVILNHVVMVPTYGKAEDQAALDAYKQVLGSAYSVVGIDSSSVVQQGGAVHCTTMQIASACGNGKLEKLLFEQCDGTEFGDKATCAAFGLPDGVLKCDPETCHVDTSGCTGVPEAGPEPAAEASAETGTEAGADGNTERGTDAAAAITPEAPTGDDGSCGCRAAGRNGASPWLAAAIAVAALRRRRS
jgi:agmatine deiminase